MAETPTPEGAAPSQRVPNVEVTPTGPPIGEGFRFFPRHIPRHKYEVPQRKGRFRAFRNAYGVYSLWLISAGVWAFTFGAFAYTLDKEHFWFHVCIELSVAALMLVLTVIFVERM